MYVGDFVELVERNKVYPNIRFISSHHGRRQGAPRDSMTVLVGDWSMTYKHGKPYLSPQHIGAYNLAVPFAPKHDIVAEDGMVITPGWAPVLGANHQ